MREPSIWKTLEMDCISRDLSYDDYVKWHRELQCSGKHLSRGCYQQLRVLFQTAMDEDL